MAREDGQAVGNAVKDSLLTRTGETTKSVLALIGLSTLKLR